MPKPKIAVSWFEDHDWPRWRELDPSFDTSRARWLSKMNATLPAVEKRGIRVVNIQTHSSRGRKPPAKRQDRQVAAPVRRGS
jgi:hypothetical protein